jgi:RND superfamily putative drug exporter
MQATMLRLDALLRRRQRLVLAAWVVVLAVAAPLAVHQSDRLTGGGFGVSGSQSQAVTDALEQGFGQAARRATLGAVLVPQAGATPAQFGAALDEVGSAARRTPRRVPPAARSSWRCART